MKIKILGPAFLTAGVLLYGPAANADQITLGASTAGYVTFSGTGSSGTPLNPDSKCNTPGRFDIGKVDQDLEECCHAILRALVDRGERPTWDLARCWALAGGDLQGAGSG